VKRPIRECLAALNQNTTKADPQLWRHQTKNPEAKKQASLTDMILQVVSPYYLYQRRVAKKSPEVAWKETTTAFKKAIKAVGAVGN